MKVEPTPNDDTGLPQIALRESEHRDAALPGTLRFVMVMGVAFLVLWYVMFELMKARW
jgi:hypothetical protein